MKIKTIRFKNINSLKNAQEVDFTSSPLREAGLFAITGPTGSGKSTLLDVISLALFNRVPRFEGKSMSAGFIQKTGSILTRNTREGYAEVVYECHQGTFRSSWSISVNRNGNLRDYEMELSDHQTGQILDFKKSQVPAENEKRIGLNYKQFISSILLAQGDFAKFLEAGKDERGELLEKITGSWIYREIGRKAFEWNKKYGEELEKMRERQEQIQNDLLSKEEMEATRRKFKELENRIQENEKERNKISEAVKLKQQMEEVYKLYHQAMKKEEEQKQKLLDFDEAYGEKLKKHQQLIPYEEQLRSWKTIRGNLEEHQKQKQKYNETLFEARQQLVEAEQTIARFLSKEPEKDQLLNELDAFEKQVTQLDHQLENLRNELTHELRQARRIAAEIDFTIDPKNLQQSRDALKDSLDETRQESRQLAEILEEADQKDPRQSKENLRKHLESASNWFSEKQWYNHYQQEIEKRSREIQEKREQLKPIPGKVKESRQHEEKLRLKLESGRKDQKIRELTASLEEQRQNLSEGEPCPLCGSKHHPYVQEYSPATDDLSEEIRLLDHQHKQQLADLEKLQLEEQNIRKTLEDLERQLKEYETQKEQKKTRLETHRQQLPGKYRDYKPGELKDYLAEKQQTLEAFVSSFERLQKLEELEPMLDHLLSISQQGSLKKEERERLYQGDDVQGTAQKLRKDYNDSLYKKKAAEQSLQSWEERYSQLWAELNEQTQQLQPALRQLQYQEVEEAVAKLLSPREYEKIKETRTGMLTAIHSAASEKKSYEQQWQQLKKQDFDQGIEALRNHQETLTNQYREMKTRRDELFSVLDHQHRLQEELSGLKKKSAEQRQQNEKWVLLNYYIGDKQGKNFSTFAQQLTLEQLVRLANRRIAALSNRYELDLPGEEEGDSLVIRDMDMGGQRRSVKTLSGGESFLISLSLALALSDLASKNVEIQSLFIDEGFGSLDQVTLDQTLDTLEKLQAESDKTIGVISHIEALKDRMDTRIEVMQDGQGYSRIQVQQDSIR